MTGVMSVFITYQVKVAVLLAVFFLFYELLLKKHTFFRLNRIVLISSAVLSFILPLCVITIRRSLPDGYQDTVSPSDSDQGTWIGFSGDGSHVFQTIVAIIYLCGAIYVFVRVIVSIVGVVIIIHRGHHHWEEDGSHIVLLDRPISPFSWLEFIVISLDDYREDLRSVVEHEKIHVDRRHSLDILFIDFVTVLQWFNPIIWLLKSELCAQHEYEVDETILARGFDSKSYQYLLVEKALKVDAFFVTNSINDSNLKNRIKMMNTKKSESRKAFRALYVIPLICLSLYATAKTEYVLPESSPDSLKVRLKGAQPVLVIDGVEHPYDAMKNVDPQTIKAITILPDSLAFKQYGEKAKNGVMLITTK